MNSFFKKLAISKATISVEENTFMKYSLVVDLFIDIVRAIPLTYPRSSIYSAKDSVRYTGVANTAAGGLSASNELACKGLISNCYKMSVVKLQKRF